jgi:hypothetical protein
VLLTTGPVPECNWAVGQHAHLEIGARHLCPGVALLNNYRSLVSPAPGNNSPIPSATVYSLVAVMVDVAAMQPLRAHGAGCRINDAAAKVLTADVRPPAAVSRSPSVSRGVVIPARVRAHPGETA